MPKQTTALGVAPSSPDCPGVASGWRQTARDCAIAACGQLGQLAAVVAWLACRR